ncbi:MAG: radical SAM protein [Planctomycetes bacterium]|nr:radical SAM protein [Planctomycetota bacterium]
MGAAEPAGTVLSDHSRKFDQLRFAYPVVSRRSKGLSLGINVNPDKVCNFHCPYCQVDRATPARDLHVDFDGLVAEVDELVGLAASGELWKHPRFASTPVALRRINDIAIAGDGEPTTYERLGEVIAGAHEIKLKHGLPGIKTILITNATRLAEPSVIAALEELRAGPYEIWAKLDAGTQGYFERVNGTGMLLRQVVKNIAVCARMFDVTIQSLFPTMAGIGPTEAEIDAYCGRLNEILAQGGNIKLVQVYTTARRPGDSHVGMLPDAELDAIAAKVKSKLNVPVETFYGRQWE